MDKHYLARAAFSKNGGQSWFWITWNDTVGNGNKHAAILSKAKELGANGWDFGQADYYPSWDYPGGTF